MDAQRLGGVRRGCRVFIDNATKGFQRRPCPHVRILRDEQSLTIIVVRMARTDKAAGYRQRGDSAHCV